jgi:two-component system response regulator
LFTSDPTLLVVEDASDHAALVRVAARRAFPGLDVRVAGDGREGIAYLAGNPPFQDRGSHPFPDLMILDLIMPDIDGFGVLEWIRDAWHPRPLPVVVLTSSSNPRDEGRALALGAAAFHRKPAKLEDLGELVRDIVQTWMQTRLPSRTQLRISPSDEVRSSKPA